MLQLGPRGPPGAVDGWHSSRIAKRQPGLGTGINEFQRLQEQNVLEGSNKSNRVTLASL
jgi:hypothetical protein